MASDGTDRPHRTRRRPQRPIVGALARASVLPDGLRTRLLRTVGARFHPSVTLRSGVWLGGDRIELAEGVRIGADCLIESPCEIGAGTVIAPRVVVLAYTHEIGPSRARATNPPVVAPVRIGRGCWIGASATIIPGVRIGDGVVIGAGAVVTSDCADDGLYVGVPARRIRDLPRGR